MKNNTRGTIPTMRTIGSKTPMFFQYAVQPQEIDSPTLNGAAPVG
jgi:hypothetical protein